MTFLYLKGLIGIFVVPGLFMVWYLWHKRALPLKAIFLATLVFAILVIPFDIYFTAQGVWTFGEQHMLGLWWWGLPLEEYLFYVTVVPGIVLLFLCLQQWLKKR